MIGAVQITLPGLPRGKGRPRFSARGGFARAYTDEKTLAYETRLANEARMAMDSRTPFDGPLVIEVIAVFPVPASWPKVRREAALSQKVRPTGKPDADNVLKIVMDGLNGTAWRDDAQVVRAVVAKRYGTEPETQVQIWGWSAE